MESLNVRGLCPRRADQTPGLFSGELPGRLSQAPSYKSHKRR